MNTGPRIVTGVGRSAGLDATALTLYQLEDGELVIYDQIIGDSDEIEAMIEYLSPRPRSGT